MARHGGQREGAGYSGTGAPCHQRHCTSPLVNQPGATSCNPSSPAACTAPKLAFLESPHCPANAPHLLQGLGVGDEEEHARSQHARQRGLHREEMVAKCKCPMVCCRKGHPARRVGQSRSAGCMPASVALQIQRNQSVRPTKTACPCLQVSQLDAVHVEHRQQAVLTQAQLVNQRFPVIDPPPAGPPA